MKRLISILISAVFILCTAAALPSELRTSADDAARKAFDEKISCTLEDGTVRFSHDIQPNIFAVFTDDEFELSRADNEDYLFTPAKDGQYVIVLFERVGIPEITFGFYINYYTFLITSHDGKIDLGENERFFIGDPDDSGDSAVLAPVVGEPMPFESEDRDYSGMMLYLAASQLKDSDYFFMYYMESSYEPLNCEAMLYPIRSSEESLWQEKNGSIFPVGLLKRLSFSERELPVIPGTVPPYAISLIGLWADADDLGQNIVTVKCKGDRTTKYSIRLNERGDIDTSSFSLTECPENDINADGKFSVADAVLLSRWLLGETPSGIINWRSADLTADDILDTFDLCLIKEKLVAG